MNNTFSQVYVVPLAILAHLKNGRLERTECRDEIYFQLGKNAMQTFKMLKVAFG